jgi:hypothetical protein
MAKKKSSTKKKRSRKQLANDAKRRKRFVALVHKWEGKL